MLSEKHQTIVIEAFSSATGYLDELLNVDNKHFNRITPGQLCITLSRFFTI